MADLTYQDIINKDILDLLDAKGLTPDEKKKLYEKMLATLQNRVIARVSDRLTDQEVEELKKILDGNDQKAFGDFFAKKNIDLAKFMVQEAMIYKTELATMAQKVKAAPDSPDKVVAGEE